MSEAAIPAATLILVREPAGGTAPELLMVERARDMSFAGGALVFPGGRIDDADRQFAVRFEAKDWAARVAAIRETVEETAIPVAIEPLPSPQEMLDLQHCFASGQPIADVLADRGLALAPDRLVPLARWIPAFHARRRFDTLFFLAEAPAGHWQPNPLEGECTGALWISAAEVLERDRAGDAQLIFPTRRTLERLARHANFAAMVEDARAHRIEPITPWVEDHGGEKFIAIPDDLGFPVIREKLEGLWRG